MVDTSLGQHGVVLQLGLAEGRAVTGDDNELGCWNIVNMDGPNGTAENQKDIPFPWRRVFKVDL